MFVYLIVCLFDVFVFGLVMFHGVVCDMQLVSDTYEALAVLFLHSVMFIFFCMELLR